MIIHNEPIEKYHAGSAISSSKLKVFRENPLLFHRTYNLKLVERPRTAALDEGAGFDTLVFDGAASFRSKYTVKPETYTDPKTNETKPWSGNSSVCKAWQESAEANGLTVLAKDCWTRFTLMHQAIQENPIASALLTHGIPQVTFRVTSENKFPGLEIQTRPDWYSEKPIDVPDLGLTSNGLPFIVDLKTTADFAAWWDPLDANNPRSGSPVWTYQYDKQAALAQWVMYQDIGQTAQFLLVVEKCEPFRVAIVQLSEDWLESAWSDVRQDLTRLNACRMSNTWPGSPVRPLVISPPLWLLERSARTAGVTT